MLTTVTRWQQLSYLTADGEIAVVGSHFRYEWNTFLHKTQPGQCQYYSHTDTKVLRLCHCTRNFTKFNVELSAGDKPATNECIARCDLDRGNKTVEEKLISSEEQFPRTHFKPMITWKHCEVSQVCRKHGEQSANRLSQHIFTADHVRHPNWLKLH